MRRRKKYKLEFLTGIFEEWRFYTISEKMLVRSKEYEKAMKATYELVNKVKSKVSEDAFKDIEEIVEFLNRPIPCCRYCLPNQEEKIPWGVSKRDISEWF